MKNNGFPTKEERWALWREAFGDSEDEILLFEEHAFSPDRFAYLRETDGTLAAALYYFDCTADGKKYAYLYAIATAKAYRGRGLCRQLMARVHRSLAEQGYAGALLLPAEESLYGFYEAMGYRTCTFLDEYTVHAADGGVTLWDVSAEVYAARRRALLPGGGVVQEGENLSYLTTMARYYLGEDFILTGTKESDTLLVHEMLGNTACAAGAVCALDCQTGRIRTVGKSKPFAMGLSLNGEALPTYFAFAFD